MKIITIPNGSHMFRGGTDGRNNSSTWITSSLVAAKLYGNVYVYKLDQAVKVLDMGDPTTVRALGPLYRKFSSETNFNTNIFESAFAVDEKSNIVHRNSEFTADDVLQRFFFPWLRQHGHVDCNVKGFGAPALPLSDVPGKFHHEELSLKSPHKFLSVPQGVLKVTPGRHRALEMARTQARTRKPRKQSRHGQTLGRRVRAKLSF
jgi:hypothetical protein